MRGRLASVVSLSCATLLVACGGSDDGGGAQQQQGETQGAKVIDPKSINGAKGTVTYCQGKDSSGEAKAAIEGFNEKFKSQGLEAKLVEFSANADEQRTQFVQRQRARSGDCDMFSSDVIWTAEFAAQKWLYDLTPYLKQREGELIPATLETVKYEGKLWGVPNTTDAGFIYYRTDQVKRPPATWQAIYEEAGQKDGIVYQGAPYEGLTVDFLELAFAAGGKVLSEDGKAAQLDSPENLKALQFMADGVKSGVAPKAVTTYMEEEARRSFEGGKATYMRNWPYAYQAGKKNKRAPEFDVVPFPSFEGGGKAGILGGHNDVISAFSKNPGASLAVIDYRTHEENQTRIAAEYSNAPTLSSTYDDPAVKKALPFAAELKQAVEQAKSRPVSPVYPQISQAISKNVHEALSGQTTPQDALKKGQAEIEKALATF